MEGEGSTVKCKYFATITADWDAFKKIQGRVEPSKEICTGVSIEKNKFRRTFCSCGHSSSELESTCPDCGGKIMHFSDGYYNRMRNYVAVFEEAGIITFAGYNIFIEYSPHCDTCSLKIEEILVGKYDKATNTWPLYNVNRTTSYRDMGQHVSSVGAELLDKTFPDFYKKFVGSGDSKFFVSRPFCTSVAGLKCYTEHPDAFKDENMDKYPLSCHRLLQLVSHDEVNGSVLGLAPMMSDDFMKCWEVFGMPTEFLPIIESVSLRCDTSNVMSMVAAPKFHDFIKTKIGRFFASRIRHGQAELYDVATYYEYWRKLIAEGGIDEDVVIFACKENADMFSEISSLYNEVSSRIKWLREQHIPVDENSIRTKVFNKAYNLANFRKTLTNTDIEDLIQTDPLKLIDRIR